MLQSPAMKLFSKFELRVLIRWAVIGIVHNPLIFSLGTWRTILLLHFIVNFCALNTSVHPESYRLIIYISELCVRLGNVGLSYDSSGKAEKYSKKGLLDCMVYSFGHPT